MRNTGHGSFYTLVLVAFLVTVYGFTSPLWGQSLTPSIQSFQLVAPKTGWLLANNRLFFTDTLGSQWSEITPAAATATLSGVYFRPDGNGWLLESSANTPTTTLTLAHTTDNGAHWTTTTIASPFTTASVFNGRASTYFPDAQHGFLMLGVQSSSAFRPGILLRTTNGGATWQQAPTPPAGGNITFLDSTHGFDGPGPAGDELYSTADAGNTWQRVTLTSPTALANTNSTIALPIFTDTTHGSLLRTYATDAGPTIVTYTTADAGATWTIASTAQSSTPTLITLAHDGSTTGRITATAAVAGLPSIAATTTLAPVRSSFATATNGWVEFKSGSCTNGVCTQTDSLRGTLDGGKTFFSLAQISGIQLETTTTFTIPTRPTSSLTPLNVHPASSTVYDTSGVMGFDACSLPTTTQMTSWYASSPYRVAGIYIGGANFACSSGLSSLTKTYVSTILNQGWQMIPIWVGPQGIGNGCGCSTMSTNTTTAESQGVTEADSAAAAMTALGLGQGSTIMYDMEAYSYGNATDTAATQAFIEGWDTELHNKGYLAAVYSSNPEFTNWYPTVVTPAIDIIWFAYFFDEPGQACGTECQTVFPNDGVFPISASYWLNNHRARQTSAGFESTYGSTTIDIDEDWVDAPMVTATPNTLTLNKTAVGGAVASTTITNSNSDSSTYTGISCLDNVCSTASANFAPTDTVTLVATPDAGLSVGWKNCTSVSGDTCTVLVSSSKTVTAAFGYPVSVALSGSGTGTVTSSDGSISCGSTCSFVYPTASTVTLTAAATNNSSFSGWTGCTTSTGLTCTVVVATAAANVTANFVPANTLTVTKSGSGSGTVTSSDSSINCGSTCSAGYAANSTVTLTATPASGSVFSSWSGCTTTSGATCTVIMSAAEAVTATFTPAPSFTGAVTPTSISVTAGASATDTLTITPQNGYAGTFTSFACTGQPATVTCSFSPTTLTATSSSSTPLTSTLTITVPSALAQLQTHERSSIVFAGLVLPGFLLLPFAFRRRTRRARKLLLLTFAIATLGCAQILTGCGGSSTPASGPTGPIFSGTMNVTYTSTPTGGLSTNNTLPITLTITQ